MQKSFEGGVSPESQERASKIVLHFLRHGKKGKAEDDYKVPLTPEGRMEAKVKAGKTNLKQAMAMGSPRARAKESAALVMAGAEDKITGRETLDELTAKLNAGRAFGSKVFTDGRLDFNIDNTTELGAKAEEAYNAKKLLAFMVHESDNTALMLDDKKTSTYSSMASGVAKIVQKYFAVSSRWHELVNDAKKNYSEDMERFLGSHQAVTESFLAKVIEKTKGANERDAFVKVLNNQGFDFLEGFDVEIIQKDSSEAPVIRIKYAKTDGGKELFRFDQEIPAQVLEDIIKEGEREGRRG